MKWKITVNEEEQFYLKNNYEAIIDIEAFERAQELLERHSKKGVKNGKRNFE